MDEKGHFHAMGCCGQFIVPKHKHNYKYFGYLCICGKVKK